MTDDTPVNLAAHEPSVTSFEATVRSVEDRDVTLDQTYFYAEGGGQPADRGTLGGVDVVDVQTVDGVTVHALATEPDFDTGTTVSGALDGSFRTYTMRAHTASHIVYGVGRTLFGDHGYGGFNIGEDTVRLDFETSGDADALDAATVQRQANQAVWDGRSVEWYEMDAAEARRDDDIVFNLGEDADATDTVRIVEIEGWDISACGGTHVDNTVEVGPIRVTDVSNPGADLVRVEFAVGSAAIEGAIAERQAATRAADVLDTSVADLPDRAAGLLEENADLVDEVARLREQLLDARLSTLAEQTTTVGDSEWLVGTVGGVGANAVADRVRGLDSDTADVFALAGRDGGTFRVVGTDGETDAGDIINDVTDEFGGGGGGQPTLAQGGGISADPESVVDYLRSASR
jgi:alanyl-tRNA synthetase